jgi:hypothetical protein
MLQGCVLSTVRKSMRLNQIEPPGFARKYARYSLVGAGLTFAVVMVVLGLSSAGALPAGFFNLVATTGSSSGPHVMEAENGLVRLNEAKEGRDSQLWKERFPTHGEIDVIRLGNKKTGTCLGDALDSSGAATLLPCTSDFTLWRKVFLGAATKVVFIRGTDAPAFSLFGSFRGCLSKDPKGGPFVLVANCNSDSDITPEMVWDAELLGFVSSPSTPPPPPPSPPPAPTSCKLLGATADCGLVGFNCDPFSAEDEIVVQSGEIGVAVTSVQPQIGLINGTYSNQGNASVAVCATKGGLSSCGDPINLTFGPRVCTGGGVPGFTCPHGQVHCGAGCAPPSPECHPR